MGQPVQTIIQACALGGTGSLDVPRAATQVLKPQLVSQFAHRHGIGHVLLVGKHQQHCIPKLILLQHLLEFISRLLDPLPVIAVHHKDEALSVLEVVPPQRPNLILASDIPDCETDVLIFHCFHIEAYGGDGGDNLPQLQFVQDGSLASRIQANCNGERGKEWRRERESPLETRERERPGQLMVMGAESGSASSCCGFVQGCKNADVEQPTPEPSWRSLG